MKIGPTFKEVSTSASSEVLWREHVLTVTGVSSSVDLALAIYPIVLFWDLRIQALKKLILSVLFAFGIM